MKQYPSPVAVETAVNALQFCIMSRSRVDAEGKRVMCVPVHIHALHHRPAMVELRRTGLYNNVIDDAIVTALAVNIAAFESRAFPRIGPTDFGYTAAQYTEALQNLFAALESTEE